MKYLIFWASLGVALLGFATARFVIPYLINMHNDGAIVFAVLWTIIVGTSMWLYCDKVLTPYLKGDFN